MELYLESIMVYEILMLIVGFMAGLILFIIYRIRINKILQTQKVEFAKKIEATRTEAVDQSRSVLKGKIGEHMAPLLPEFQAKYEPADARFIGAPIDYLIFKNMKDLNTDKNVSIEVILLDVKTGKSNLSGVQRAIKKAIEEKRVKFEVLRLADPDESSRTA